MIGEVRERGAPPRLAGFQTCRYGNFGKAGRQACSYKDRIQEDKMTQAGIAAVLSLILPGAGQIYNGDFLRGIFWLIVTPGLWIGSGGTLGWICHVIAAYTAYSRGAKYMRGELGGVA